MEKLPKVKTISILPCGITTKIRGIQVHNENSEFASAGQRCALNILGIEKSAIKRGDVVTTETWIKPITIADAVLYTTKGKINIINNQRVHVNIGTKEILARITVIGAEKINSGSKGYAQLRFEEPMVALRGDRFIIRAFSPVVTLGGGLILSHVSKKRGRFKEETIEELRLAETGNMKELIKQVMKNSTGPLTIDEIWHIVLGEKSEVVKNMQDKSFAKEIVILKSTNKYISKYLCNEYLKKIENEFNVLYKNYPFRFEIDKEEIKSKLFNNLDIKDFTDILNYYTENNILLIEKNKIRENDDIVISNIMEMKETKLLEHTIFQYGLNVKTSEQIKKEIVNQANKSLLNNYEDIEKFLIGLGIIVNLGNDLIIHRDILQESVNKIRNLFRNQEFVTAVFLRDYFKCSRKTAISILEYLDVLGVTERQNDVRQPGVHYMDFFI